MKRTSKRLFCVWIVCVMLLTMLPTAALADENVAQIGDAGYESLSAAISAAQDGDTVTLLADTSETLSAPSVANLTIDLGNNTLTLTNTGSIVLDNGKNLTIQNGSLISKAKASGDKADFNIMSGASITLNNVQVDSTASVLYPQGDAAKVTVIDSTIKCGVYAVGTNANSVDNYNIVITLKDSTFISGYGWKSNDMDSCPVMINVPGTLNMDGCTVIGSRQAVLVRGGTATITNSTITLKKQYSGDSTNGYLGKNWSSGNEVPMAALVVGNRVAANGSYKYPATCTLSGTTTISATDGLDSIYVYEMANDGYDRSVTLNISDGTYGTVSVNSAESAEATVVITGGSFSDLSCIDYLASGAEVTVKLADDVALNTRYSIKAKVTLDLAGHSITIGDTVEAMSGLFVVDNDGDLTIEDSSDAKTGEIDVTTNRKYTGTDYPAIWAAVTVYPDPGYTAKLTVNGGTLKAPYYPITGSGNCTDTDCTTITINGGKLESTNGLAVYHPQNGNLVVNGGELLGQETAIEMRAGTLTVNGGVFTATNTPTETQANGSGTTTNGAAIAVCQHTTKLRTEVTINGGTFNGFSALYEHNAQNNSAEDLQKVVLKVTGGTFNTTNNGTVAVYSADKTGFITGGAFSSDPTDYVAENGTSNIVKRSGSEGSYTYTVMAKTNLTDGVYMSDPTGYTAANYSITNNGDGTYTVYYVAPYVPPVTPPTTTETTENEDGSTTTTVTDNTTGTVTETTTSQPVTDEEGNTTQTVTETVTNADGSSVETVTETVEAADGSTTETKTETVTDADGAAVTTETVTATDTTGTTATTTTVTDAAGETETQVAVVVSQEAADSSAETGEPVTLPVTVTADESAPAIEVIVPADVTAENTVTVEIPVENLSAGTVVVIVNEDGSEEIVKASSMGENGVVVALDGDATVKVVDNSKVFEDVQPVDHWADEAVTYVAAREIFNGTGPDIFEPETEMTRAMLMTVLARFEGEDTEGGETWYEKGMEWAVTNGVSDGSAPEAPITREQMAVMLYRYAGSPASSQELDYPDAGDVSDYAVAAMRWAVEIGLINGMDGSLNPQGYATRAQVATIMMRFCQNVA